MYRKQRFAGFEVPKTGVDALFNQADHQELYVLGLPSTLFRDDAAAEVVETERHLVPWHGDYSLMMDRFDVRLLLDDVKVFESQLDTIEHDSHEAEIDQERYVDLDYSKEWQLENFLHNQPGIHEHDDTHGEFGQAPFQGQDDENLGNHDHSNQSVSHDSGDDSQDEGEESGGRSEEEGGEGNEYDSEEDAPLPPPPRPVSVQPDDVHRALTPPPPYYAAHTTQEQQQQPGQDAYQTVQFQYTYADESHQGTRHDSDVLQQHEKPQPAGTAQVYVKKEESTYQPPFDVPSHIKHVPLDDKQDKVIIETARFVRRGGGQVEVLLRVRQADNPSFTFLQPHDPLHAYFRWHIAQDPKEIVHKAVVTVPREDGLGQNSIHSQHTDSAAVKPKVEQTAAAAEEQGSSALKGLLSAYGDDDEEQGTPRSRSRSGATVSTSTSRSLSTDSGSSSTSTTSRSASSSSTSSSSSSGDDSGSSREKSRDTSRSLVKSRSGTRSRSPDAAARSPSPRRQPDEDRGRSRSRAGSRSRSRSPAPSPPPISFKLAGRSRAVAPATKQASAAHEVSASNDVVKNSIGGSESVSPDQDESQALLIINKLVPFVKRSGAKFELTVRKREANNLGFGFLNPTHPLHYLYRNALAQACGSVQEADNIVQESIKLYNESTGTAALEPLEPGSSQTAPPGPGPSNVKSEVLQHSQQDTEHGVVTAPVHGSKPAIIGPQNKPLVLKANPKVITRHQTDAVRAAQQAAAAIAAQAAATKAAAQQEGPPGGTLEDASQQAALRTAIIMAKQSAVQTPGDVHVDASASQSKQRHRKRGLDMGIMATPETSGGASASQSSGSSDVSDSDSGDGSSSHGDGHTQRGDVHDHASSRGEDNNGACAEDHRSDAAAVVDKEEHDLNNAGKCFPEDRLSDAERRSDDADGSPQHDDDPWAGVVIGGTHTEAVDAVDMMDSDLMLGDVPGGVDVTTAALTDEDRARLAERRLKARSMLADKMAAQRRAEDAARAAAVAQHKRAFTAFTSAADTFSSDAHDTRLHDTRDMASLAAVLLERSRTKLPSSLMVTGTNRAGASTQPRATATAPASDGPTALKLTPAVHAAMHKLVMMQDDTSEVVDADVTPQEVEDGELLEADKASKPKSTSLPAARIVLPDGSLAAESIKAIAVSSNAAVLPAATGAILQELVKAVEADTPASVMQSGNAGLVRSGVAAVMNKVVEEQQPKEKMVVLTFSSSTSTSSSADASGDDDDDVSSGGGVQRGRSKKQRTGSVHRSDRSGKHTSERHRHRDDVRDRSKGAHKSRHDSKEGRRSSDHRSMKRSRRSRSRRRDDHDMHDMKSAKHEGSRKDRKHEDTRRRTDSDERAKHGSRSHSQRHHCTDKKEERKDRGRSRSRDMKRRRHGERENENDHDDHTSSGNYRRETAQHRDHGKEDRDKGSKLVAHGSRHGKKRHLRAASRSGSDDDDRHTRKKVSRHVDPGAEKEGHSSRDKQDRHERNRDAQKKSSSKAEQHMVHVKDHRTERMKHRTSASSDGGSSSEDSDSGRGRRGAVAQGVSGGGQGQVAAALTASNSVAGFRGNTPASAQVSTDLRDRLRSLMGARLGV